MIRFALKCHRGHGFESWFASGAGYAQQRAAQLVACPVCGSTGVEKALMTPHVAAAPEAPGGEADPPADASPPSPPPPAERRLWASGDSRLVETLTQLRREVEARTEDVGEAFAAEVRAIEAGEAPRRAVRGLASAQEARSLRDEGAPVLPLPFRDPHRAH